MIDVFRILSSDGFRSMRGFIDKGRHVVYMRDDERVNSADVIVFDGRRYAIVNVTRYNYDRLGTVVALSYQRSTT